MYDYDKARELGERALVELQPDVYSPFLLNVTAGPVLDALDYKQLIWPGHGVGDNQPFQYLDREYMKADEYDEFIADPTGFYLRKYLPRVSGAFIARAIANEPPLVLADKPTGNLDSKSGQMVYDLLREIARDRTVLHIATPLTLYRSTERRIIL